LDSFVVAKGDVWSGSAQIAKAIMGEMCGFRALRDIRRAACEYRGWSKRRSSSVPASHLDADPEACVLRA
jgi:hypothetical protein